MITFFLQMRRTLRVLWSIFKDDETRGIAGVTAVLLLSGTLFYANVEHFTYLDALYFSFTTLTTIGYGDIYPVTAAGKIFTMMYSVVGLGVMGSFLAVVVKKLGQLDKKSERRPVIYRDLLFDLDHTLLDFNAAEDVALTELLTEAHVDDVETYKEVYIPMNRKLWNDLSLKKITKKNWLTPVFLVYLRILDMRLMDMPLLCAIKIFLANKVRLFLGQISC